MERIRIYYAKTEPLRYTGNLDVHRVWERLLRRARLPLAYSQGFHPQPRLNQASPLPLGFLSQAEMIDLWLAEDLDLDVIQSAVENAAPPGIITKKVERIPLTDPSLPARVAYSDYLVRLLDPVDSSVLQEKINDLLATPVITRERRGKSYDLRPLIHTLEVQPNQEEPHVTLFMRLSASQGATGRPDEVVSALGIEAQAARIERIALHLNP